MCYAFSRLLAQAQASVTLFLYLTVCSFAQADAARSTRYEQGKRHCCRIAISIANTLYRAAGMHSHTRAQCHLQFQETEEIPSVPRAAHSRSRARTITVYSVAENTVIRMSPRHPEPIKVSHEDRQQQHHHHHEDAGDSGGDYESDGSYDTGDEDGSGDDEDDEDSNQDDDGLGVVVATARNGAENSSTPPPNDAIAMAAHLRQHFASVSNVQQHEQHHQLEHRQRHYMMHVVGTLARLIGMPSQTNGNGRVATEAAIE